MQFFKRFFNISLMSVFTLTLGINQAANADINIPDTPIFVGTNIQPNIMLAVDDSGSMDWEVLLSNEALNVHGPGGLNFFRNSGNIFLFPHIFNFTGGEPIRDLVERELCAGYNVLAYNPAITYTPWLGEDNAGNAYTDMSLTQARIDPYDPNSITNLNNSYYYVWNDDGDNVYENGECPTPATLNTAPAANANVVYVTTGSAEATNYANWYSYYRKRELVLKRVMSELITTSTARMGLATLHNNNDVGTAVADMTINTDKDTLLDEVFQINSTGGTPLRRLLDNVGRYYEGVAQQPNSDQLGFDSNSPILSQSLGGECQQNYTVLMSDGFWNGGFTGLGNTDGGGTPTTIQLDVNGDNTPESIQLDGGPHADNSSNTLADIAMHYYERDLSTLADNVPFIPVIDENNQQHMVTYGVAFGVTGTLAAPVPGAPVPANHDPATPPPLGNPVATTGGWPAPTANAQTTIDDLRHAAFNGRGEFLSAEDPQQLITSLLAAIQDINSRNSFSGTSVALSNTILRGDSFVFSAGFDSEDNTGSLAAFEIFQNGNVAQNPSWDAASVSGLNRTTSGTSPNRTTTGAITPRNNIYTIVNKSGTDTPIQFSTADPDLVAATAPPLLPPATTPAFPGSDVINYIAGDWSREQNNTANAPNNTFRNREDTLLGDIVSSTPFVSTSSDFSYDVLPGSEGANYNAYLSIKRQRYSTSSGDANSLVLVGANDGMLHAFRTLNNNGTPSGTEVFGYVPKTVHSNLHLLTDPSYGHKFYVNSPGFAGDAYLNGTWNTVYASALGEGGRGVFLLDITDPFANNNNPALWERNSNDAGYEQLGLIDHSPNVVRLYNGKWGVIFGNGYNSGSGTAENNKAQIFILDAEDGSIIKQFDTNTGGTGATSTGQDNGMAEPLVVDIDNDRIADYIYAGDLLGNMWKIDITSTSENAWDFSHGSTTNPEPFYTAVEAVGGAPQSITSKPTIATHPEGGFVLLFGTGKFLEPNDNFLTPPVQQNTFYGLRDRLNGSRPAAARANKVAQTVDNTVAQDGSEGRITSDNPVNPNLDGWYLDYLIEPGERIISAPIVIFGFVFFNTYIPTNTPCNFDGDSFLTGIDAIQGRRPQAPLFNFNSDDIVDSNDLVNGTAPSAVKISGTIGGPGLQVTKDGLNFLNTKLVGGGRPQQNKVAGGDLILGRTSWRQIQ